LRNPIPRLLISALAINILAVVFAFVGQWLPAAVLFIIGAGSATTGLGIFGSSPRPPKLVGVHSTFPTFIRIAYAWLLVSAIIGIAAAVWDSAGGLWGASRHALTVGFMSTMVFAIGQRVLPAFCGMRILFSPALMFAGLGLLNFGCALRVISEIAAYEGYIPSLWPMLPVSAITEMVAVTVFALNLLITFRQPPPHVSRAAAAV
jgi:hypothetical protein